MFSRFEKINDGKIYISVEFIDVGECVVSIKYSRLNQTFQTVS